MEFDTQEDVIEWILLNQLGRRNLSAYERGVLALQYQGILKEKGLKNMSEGGKGSEISPDLKVDSREEAANTFNISSNTLNKIRHIEAAASTEQKEDLKTGNKSINEVYKEVKKEERREKIDTEIQNASTLKIPEDIKILQGDVFEMLKKVDDKSVDLLCTDPPYFTTTEEWDQFVDETDYLYFMAEWMAAAFKKLKPTGRAYISVLSDYQFKIWEILRDVNFFGFDFFGSIIWHKSNAVAPFDKRLYRYNYEPILHLYGPEIGPLNFTEFNEIQGSVWNIAIPQTNFNNDTKLHPCQKPLELYRRIITTGSKPGNLVLDCFAGSGTTGVICKENKRRCILIEQEAAWVELIKGRINKGV